MAFKFKPELINWKLQAVLAPAMLTIGYLVARWLV
jgi:hypothetical protein